MSEPAPLGEGTSGAAPTSLLATRGGRGIGFAAAGERDAEAARLGGAGMLVVELEGIGPSTRGRLAERIAEAVERELSGRGAPGPGIESAGALDAALGDQLYRARKVGATGIAIVLGPLRRAAGALGALQPEDGHALRTLARATRERPVVLLLDESDRDTGAYGDPVPLGPLVMEGDERDRDPEPDRDPDPVPDPPPPPLDRHTAGASVVQREEPWRTWTLQLAAAKGPQALAAMERLFADSYMPLCHAIAAGLDDPRARAAQEEFRTGFAKSYTDAFPTLSVSTKRPRMVLDAHDVAARIARLHGARSTRLLLVDAMRWDLCRLVEQRITSRLGAKASITDELVLWSALPSTTMRQLETIARGVDALRTPGPVDDGGDTEALRGRTSDYVRRLRVGPRELHKLDLVHARLLAAHTGVLAALPEIAEATAQVIVRHAETLPARTLLFVFGDHGFVIDKRGAMTQGGASPEEVLCGAFGLLVGDVH